MNQFALLTERQQVILQTIVNTHVTTAEAVGSRTVAKKLGNRLSPASIRNVMSDLEDMGYVRQPHTSAGRIPTDSGYRIYVNTLMQIPEPALEHKRWIEGHYRSENKQIENLLELSAKILSMLTHYTALVQIPKVDEETIKRVQLVPLSSKKVVVVLVTSLGDGPGNRTPFGGVGREVAGPVLLRSTVASGFRPGFHRFPRRGTRGYRAYNT